MTVDVRTEADGALALWVHEEDHLALARDELAAFETEPDAERFRQVSEESQDSMNETQATETRAERAGRPAWQRLPVTFGLIGISVVVFLAMEFGGDYTKRLHSDLSIASFVIRGDSGYWQGLSDIRNGQIWRLVTPIFMHGGSRAGTTDAFFGNLLHLVFNMAWIWLLGAAIETIRGHFRLLFLVLVTAVASNLLEYWFNVGFSFDMENGFVNDSGYDPNPFFLGMSGVVFGLFGFVWMRARLIPRSGFAMPRDTVVWLLIWLVVCTTGLVGPIANVAHGSGLLAGMILGAAPRLWQRG